MRSSTHLMCLRRLLPVTMERLKANRLTHQLRVFTYMASSLRVLVGTGSREDLKIPTPKNSTTNSQFFTSVPLVLPSTKTSQAAWVVAKPNRILQTLKRPRSAAQFTSTPRETTSISFSAHYSELSRRELHRTQTRPLLLQ